MKKKHGCLQVYTTTLATTSMLATTNMFAQRTCSSCSEHRDNAASRRSPWLPLARCHQSVRDYMPIVANMFVVASMFIGC